MANNEGTCRMDVTCVLTHAGEGVALLGRSFHLAIEDFARSPPLNLPLADSHTFSEIMPSLGSNDCVILMNLDDTEANRSGDCVGRLSLAGLT